MYQYQTEMQIVRSIRTIAKKLRVYSFCITTISVANIFWGVKVSVSLQNNLQTVSRINSFRSKYLIEGLQILHNCKIICKQLVQLTVFP